MCGGHGEAGCDDRFRQLGGEEGGDGCGGRDGVDGDVVEEDGGAEGAH